MNVTLTINFNFFKSFSSKIIFFSFFRNYSILNSGNILSENVKHPNTSSLKLLIVIDHFLAEGYFSVIHRILCGSCSIDGYRSEYKMYMPTTAPLLCTRNQEASPLSQQLPFLDALITVIPLASVWMVSRIHN